MGNGVPFNMLCCNQRKESQIEDIDINNNSKDIYINYKTIKTIKLPNNKGVIKENFQNNNNKPKYKKVQTKFSSASNNKRQIKIFDRGDSVSQKDPNISLYNNTFQILNNTQQYISFSNMNLLKNNLINNQLLSPLYNSKLISSLINMSKINSNFEDLIDINIKLIITGDLIKNRIIEIDKFGMKNSLRKKKDGVTIFGCKDDNDNSNSPLFDYYLDLNMSQKQNSILYKKQYFGKVFEIFLDKIEKAFFLYFVHHTLILYYKINEKLVCKIDKEYYLILGDIFLSINVKKSINSNEKIINIQVELEDEKPLKYTFEKKDVPIKIGRCNCNINIPKPSISKIHSIIDFSDDNFIYKDSESTNGSTLIIKEDDILKLKGEMNFKLEEISFKIKEIIIDEK